MNEIIPSPGTENKNWEEIEQRLNLVKPFAKSVHIDVLDGKFAPNTTFSDASKFSQFTKDTLFEVHLMVDNPVQYLKAWADAGFKRFIGQIEKMPDPIEFVAQGQLLGEVGLAIDGPTEIGVLDNMNLNDLDCLLIMTINAGFSGQEFKAEMLDKVRKIKEKYPYLTIEVDGGIKENTIVEAKNAGASRFVTTSALYEATDVSEEFKKLTSLIL